MGEFLKARRPQKVNLQLKPGAGPTAAGVFPVPLYVRFIMII